MPIYTPAQFLQMLESQPRTCFVEELNHWCIDEEDLETFEQNCLEVTKCMSCPYPKWKIKRCEYSIEPGEAQWAILSQRSPEEEVCIYLGPKNDEES